MRPKHFQRDGNITDYDHTINSAQLRVVLPILTKEYHFFHIVDNYLFSPWQIYRIFKSTTMENGLPRPWNSIVVHKHGPHAPRGGFLWDQSQICLQVPIYNIFDEKKSRECSKSKKKIWLLKIFTFLREYGKLRLSESTVHVEIKNYVLIKQSSSYHRWKSGITVLQLKVQVEIESTTFRS